MSFIPTRVPGGRAPDSTPPGTPSLSGGMSHNTQCTQTRLGAAGSGASGSSTIRARLRVPAGIPDQASGGDDSSPWQVCPAGIDPPCVKAEDVRLSGIGVLVEALQSARRNSRTLEATRSSGARSNGCGVRGNTSSSAPGSQERTSALSSTETVVSRSPTMTLTGCGMAR